MNTRIKNLTLQNFKKFENLSLSLHPELCVFVGDNGAGKTSVLEALSVLISSIFPYCQYLPRIGAKPFETGHIRAWRKNVRGIERLQYADEARISCEMYGVDASVNLTTISVEHQKGQNRRKVSDSKLLSALFQQANNYIDGIPVFSHYGAHRGAEQGDRKRFGRKKVDYTNPCSAYINALKPSLDFDLFLNWCRDAEHEEYIARYRKTKYIPSGLDVVRRALEKMFETSLVKYSDPHFVSNPMRFTMVQNDGRESLSLPFDLLSDGYRAVIALVADFARRLAIANQFSDQDPLLGRGILLIDEIDAHLHPSWQYRIISDLRRTFPNIQLIVTTHSAEVISSIDKSCVYIMDDIENRGENIHPNLQTKGDSPEYISEAVMRSHEAYRATEEYQAYLRCLVAIENDDIAQECFEVDKNIVIQHYGSEHHITRSMLSKLEGLIRKKVLLARIKR